VVRPDVRTPLDLRHRRSYSPLVTRRAKFLREDQDPDAIRRKLAAVRAAARGDYPTADIGQMLAEVAGSRPSDPTTSGPA
jgi:hypothetical protein